MRRPAHDRSRRLPLSPKGRNMIAGGKAACRPRITPQKRTRQPAGLQPPLVVQRLRCQRRKPSRIPLPPPAPRATILTNAPPSQPDHRGSREPRMQDHPSNPLHTTTPVAPPQPTNPLPGRWTPERLELREWFAEAAPAVAGPYAGVVALLDMPAFPGKSYFVCHIMREIADNLAAIVTGQEISTPTQYANELDKADQRGWPTRAAEFKTNNAAKSTESAKPQPVTIPWEAYIVIDDLIQVRRNSRNRGGKIGYLYQVLAKCRPGEESRRLLNRMHEHRTWFMGKTHLPKGPKAPVLPTEDELAGRVASFEKILHAFVGHFFTATRGLDAILQEANATTD